MFVKLFYLLGFAAKWLQKHNCNNSAKWQKWERNAYTDIVADRMKGFDSVDDLIEDLDK
jgi:hypothetical protein